MRNRNKHKKNNATVESITGTNKDEKVDQKNKDDKGQNNSTSRSRSRGRRSLSTLFRKSTARDESRGENEEPINDADPFDDPFSDINPRIDPRGHLQRMTVREALVYNKKRGRSPNRKALKLAKKVMPDEVSLSKDSLSSSMPDLLEQISDCVEPGEGQGWKDVRGGATLPRIKKRRPGIDHSFDMPDNDAMDTTDNALPLDKRKYLINKDENIDSKVVHEVAKSDKRLSIISHSTAGSDQLSDKIKQVNVESRRRDSYTKCMQLQEESPEISVLPTTAKPSAMPSKAAKDLPNISISTSTTLESLIQPTLYSDVFAEVHRAEPADIQKIDKKLHRLSETEVYDHQSEDKSKFVDRQISTDTNRSGSRRSSYVSPRRFSSRSSRASVTSNKSNLSNSSSQSAIGNNDFIAQKLSPNDTTKGKYSRQFSRESSRESAKVMVCKETSTENELAVCKYVDSATQTIDIKPATIHVDVACQNDDLLEPEHNESSSNRSELENDNDCEVFCPELKREVVIVEQRSPVRRLGRKSVDSVFKPIGVTNRQRKVSEIAADNVIEQLPDVSEQKDDALSKKSSKKRSKKSKDKRRKSTCSSKTRDRQSEGDETLNVEDKLRRSKSMSAKPSNNKESKQSRGIEVQKEETKPVQRSSSNASRKRSKSVPRKISKEKKDKSTVATALRKAGRAASLSQVFESMESVRNLDTDKKSGLKKSNKSRSLDSVNNPPNDKFEESIKKIKSDHVKKQEAKKQPKLSFIAVVALKSRLARIKKAKQSKEEPAKDDIGESDIPNNEKNMDDDNDDDVEPNIEDDLSTAKVYYENEINTSIGKSTNSLEMIEAVDQEVKDIVYEKRIQFSTPYCDEPLSEEDLIKQRQRNTRLTSRRESKVRQRQKKVISCCKKFIAFLFSHIGLCSLVVAYCILGGFIFKELEGPHEMQKKREITALRQNFTEMIHRLAFETALTKGNREVFKTEVNAILKNFSVIIHKQTKEAGWDGQEIKNDTKNQTGPVEPEQWSYPSSLLYAITVMTTIGK